MKLSPIDFLKKFMPYAIESEQKSGINRWVTLAQGAAESGWDSSEAGHNNIFGIKSKTKPNELVKTFEYNKSNKLTAVQVGLDPASPMVVSAEPNSNGNYRYDGYAYFKVYTSYADAFDAHNAVLLQSNFADARPFMNNPESFVATIAPHYAPGNTGYAGTVISIMHSLQKLPI